MSEIVATLGAVKEVVVTVAAATGAVVALLGLRAWRRQLTGKIEYEVAIRYLRAVYKVRDSIALVRSPFMSAGEMAHAVREKEPAGVKQDASALEPDATAAAYELRWKSVMEATSDLQVVTQEAEVLWGRQPVELLGPLRKCVAELNWAVGAYLREQSGRFHDRDQDLSDKAFKIAFWMGDDPKEDPFSGKVKEAVEAVEKFIRPRLG